VTGRTQLKICGVTNTDDACLVSASGADYCGILIDVGFSERTLTLETGKHVAQAASIPVVILLCDPDINLARSVALEIRPHALQLLGRETPSFVKELKSRCSCQVWKTIHLAGISGQASPGEYVEAGADVLLVDSADASDGKLRFGGTGKVGDWKAAADLIKRVSIPVFLAGGIGPDNVEAALLEVRPFGIDLCSGVESSRGKKDPEKVKALLHNFNAALEKMLIS
jgi:phosphoribosylanthranilate isomerase